jgi:hypothetical protein
MRVKMWWTEENESMLKIIWNCSEVN